MIATRNTDFPPCPRRIILQTQSRTSGAAVSNLGALTHSSIHEEEPLNCDGCVRANVERLTDHKCEEGHVSIKQLCPASHPGGICS